MSLSDRIRSLSPEQRALLEKRLRTKEQIPRRDPSELPSLSFAQQRMWFLDQLEPENIAYNSPVAIRFSGALDRDLLKKALRMIVDRHATLRSRFPTSDGRPTPDFLDASEVRIRRADLSDTPPENRMAEARRLAKEEMRQPFDLARGPLIRPTVYRLADDLHLLTIAAHHIAIDGWSIGVLVRELAETYASLSAGRPPALPELPIDYADYAAWQRDWLSGSRLDKQVYYWREKLDGHVATVEIPTDRPRPEIQSFNGARESAMVSDSVVEGARQLALSTGSTLFMVLLATLKTLVHRHTRESDIIIGSPIANRRHREIEHLVGYIANTLVLRSDLSGDPTFLELLGRVRETSLSAFEHQDLPFERLVEEVPSTRDTNRTPFFGITLTLQNAPISAPPIPGLEIDVLRVDNGTAKFDLSLVAVETADGLQVTAEYATDLYDPATVRRLLGHFETLLAAASASPDTRISALPMLTAEESGELLRLPEVREFPVSCLHTGFENHAALTPRSLALVDGERRLSYGELNALANGLAHRLIAAGVGIESPVALLLDRSAEQIVATLAVLKAGGAYVPLDTGNPAARLRLILDDSRAAVVVTSRELAEMVPGTDAEVLFAEDIPPDDRNPDRPVRPEHLAYIMYTSGSTGVPKGVLIEHRHVSRLFSSTAADFGFGPGTVSAIFHSYAFDLSVWEIFSALLHGGSTVVVPYLTSRSADHLLDLLETEKVTMLLQTPSAFRALQAADDGRDLALEHLVFGGEMLPMKLLTGWFGRRGDERPAVFNMYGPTETTVFSMIRRVRNEDLDEGSMIGRALPDSRCVVLDQHRTPVPIGVPGELHTDGPGLARGYLRRPEKQAEVFLADMPHWPGRWYRTGDIVRLRESGDIEFLGREDAQLKIRGFRVEIGEIEAAICSLPEFAAAVVLVRDDLLTAYCITDPCQHQAKEQLLRTYLPSHLPAHMLPSAFVFLESLPTTTNGKLDRDALHKLQPVASCGTEGHVEPSTDIERQVAAIWSDVLRRDRIGLNDDFFRMGGHSLLAPVLIGRMEKVLGCRIPLRSLFENPTIAGILRTGVDDPATMDGEEDEIEVGRL